MPSEAAGAPGPDLGHAGLRQVPLTQARLPAPAWGAFTTQAGGGSSAPFSSLNLSMTVGDDVEDVQANRVALQGVADVQTLVFGEQVHGADVAVVGARQSGTVACVDALVTTAAGIGLVVLAADCLPVLLADPVARVAGAAHAGRRGLTAGVLQATVTAMVRLGAAPSRLQVRLGPAVCGGCYELPAELADEVGRTVPGSRSTTRAGTPSIDLAAGARAVLHGLGIGQVEQVGGCTIEDVRQFSHRRDQPTGRHAGIIALRPGPAGPGAPVVAEAGRG